MSEEEFTIESIGMEESYCDHSYILRGEEVISDGIPSADARSIVDLLNELSEEIMSLRWENTKLKLVLKDIVEDLETEAERKVPIIIQKEYVDWVKSNVNLRLNSSKLNRPGDLDE